MATVSEALLKLEAHERECAVRMISIERRLDAGAQRFKKSEAMLISMYPLIIADTKQKIAHEIATMSEKHAQEIAVAQIALNTQDAKGNWFQSSWRPATGWVCVLALGVNYLISPLAAGFGILIPQADGGTLMPILMGMLGLGGMRSFEKTKQIQGK